MKNWKIAIGILVMGATLTLAACEKEKEPPKPPPPDPLTACRNECRSTSEKMFKECSDKMASEQAFDRMSECNTQADEYSKNCRAQCDAKFATAQ